MCFCFCFVLFLINMGRKLEPRWEPGPYCTEKQPFPDHPVYNVVLEDRVGLHKHLYWNLLWPWVLGVGSFLSLFMTPVAPYLWRLHWSSIFHQSKRMCSLALLQDPHILLLRILYLWTRGGWWGPHTCKDQQKTFFHQKVWLCFVKHCCFYVFCFYLILYMVVCYVEDYIPSVGNCWAAVCLST